MDLMAAAWLNKLASLTAGRSLEDAVKPLSVLKNGENVENTGFIIYDDRPDYNNAVIAYGCKETWNSGVSQGIDYDITYIDSLLKNTGSKLKIYLDLEKGKATKLTACSPLFEEYEHIVIKDGYWTPESDY